ncbi:MAG: secondary thiamine-phosphate synthase enzyme YjbQ [bacterium]
MIIFKRDLTFKTKGMTDILDITPHVRQEVEESGVRDGVVIIFVPGSTAGVTTIEYESGVLQDLVEAIDRLAPQSIHYHHDARWGDGNGFAHVRSALLGPSLCIPFCSRRLQLGTWQQIVLIDFDNRPRQRDIFLQILGE